MSRLGFRVAGAFVMVAIGLLQLTSIPFLTRSQKNQSQLKETTLHKVLAKRKELMN